MKKPNLFIVGAARAGTTALWHCLKENPQVFMPGDLLLKEPAFFSRLKKTRFNQWEDYIKIFSAANENHRWVGEASTAYLTDPDSARQIYDYNPDARIIILLRNPVQRAYSLYNWMVQEGYEYARSFEEALLLEDNRKTKEIPNFYEPEYYYNFLYFSSGLYYDQVKRYQDLFGQNVLVVKFEDLTNHFASEYARVCRFLDVEPNRIDGAYKNESSAVISSCRQFLLRKLIRFYLANKIELSSIKNKNNRDEFKKRILGELRQNTAALEKVVHIGIIQRLQIMRVVKKIIPKLYVDELGIGYDSKEVRDALLQYGMKKKSPGPIKPNTASMLKEKYKPGILKLSEFTGTDFSGWVI